MGGPFPIAKFWSLEWLGLFLFKVVNIGFMGELSGIKNISWPCVALTNARSSRDSVLPPGRCDEDDDSDVASPGGSRATYMSANCVVFTHYTGDVASVVDQHFSRALSYAQDKASPGSDKGKITESQVSSKLAVDEFVLLLSSLMIILV